MCYHCDWQEVVEDIDKFVGQDAWLWSDLLTLKSVIQQLEHVTPPQRQYIDLTMDGAIREVANVG